MATLNLMANLNPMAAPHTMRDDQAPGAARKARRLATLATLLLLIGGSLRLPPAFADDDAEDGAVRLSLSAIQTAFRTQKPEGLTPILPAESKVLVSLESFDGSAGYYGRDQVYLILQKVFRELRTVRFDIEIQKPPASSNPPEAVQTAHCIGTWVYSRRGSASIQTRLHFLLSAKNGKWSLMQIREAR